VGIVWTDGDGKVIFEAYGPCGLLGSIGPLKEPGFPDSSFTGGTADDRFFGFIAPNGVSKIVIKNTTGGIETDHLQYGYLPQ
jgi:hypothetical protein